MATTTTTRHGGARTHRARQTDGAADVPALARYRTSTPVRPVEGLSSRQAAEITRISARHGHTTWRLRADKTVLLAIHGDDPTASDQPTYLVLLIDGTIVRPAALRRSY